MYNEWSLECFYKGIDDPALASDMEKLEQTFNTLKSVIPSLSYDDTVKSLLEVIDLKEYETDPLFYIMRPIWFIWRRIKRLFKH